MVVLGHRSFNQNLMKKVIGWMGGLFVAALTVIFFTGAAPPKYVSFSDLVWTNNGNGSAQIVHPPIPEFLVETNATASVYFENNSTDRVYAVNWVININETSAQFPIGLELDMQNGSQFLSSSSWGLVVANFLSSTNANNVLYDNNGTVGVKGSASANGDGQSVGVLGQASSIGNLSYGIVGLANTFPGTNVGVAGVGFVNPGKYIGGYFETPDALVDPVYENAVILADSRALGAPLLIGRTNNGSTVFRLESNGDIKQSGTLYATNAVWIPTNSTLHIPFAGGGLFWNSNSALYWITQTKTNLITNGL